MAEQFKNLASTTLTDGIDGSTTSITVGSAMGFAGGDFRILIDSEIMKVTAVSGTTLTVVRAQENTSATSHTSATEVYHVLTAGALDAHDRNDLAVYDTYANRPAAGTPGRIFLPTDGAFLERDNGTAWEKYGPIWPMTPPTTSTFSTWLNQSTSTVTDAKGPLYFNAAVATSATIRAILKSYLATPFTVEIAILPTILPYTTTSDVAAGLCIRDSATGKIEMYGLGNNGADMQIKGYYYSSATASGTSVTGWPTGTHFSESTLLWLRYTDDGTYRVISISVDGCTWTQLLSVSRTTNLTPDQIGIGIKANAAYTSSSPYFSIDSGVTILHWKES